MELRQLITFATVAETGNMTAAAMRLSITQAAVSHQIKALERDMRVKLFDRHSKDVVLTEEGKCFLESAKDMIRIAEDSRDRLESMNGHICGRLNIGVGSFIAPYIRRAAVEFIKKYPDVQLKVQFDNADVLNELLRSEKLDLAFTMNFSYHFEGIVSKPCVPFKLSAIMSKRNELANKEFVTYEDLMKCKIVMPDVGERVFQTFQRYTPYDLSKFNVPLISSNPAEALMVIDQLNFVTFLPSDYVITSQMLVSKPIKSLEMELNSNVHWLKDKTLKASAKAFLEIVEKHY